MDAASQQRADWVRELGRLTETVSRARRLEQIFDAALACLRDSLGAERSSILLFDDQGVMRFAAWRGLSEGYRAAVEGHSPWAADAVDPQPIIIPDVTLDPELAGYANVFALEKIRALVFVPLVCDGALLGKFMLYYAQPRSLDPAAIDCARTIAAHIAFAVRRYRSHAQANEAERRKDEFLAMLGHELRNPLAPIVSALQLMEMKAPETCTRERAIIDRQVQHLLRLIDDLLDVSRITRGKLELRRRQIEIGEVIAQAIEVASPLLEEQQHELVVDVPEDGLAVFGDPARLAQVMSNLLTNAAKYTEPSGRVTVAARADGDDVAVRITDTGIGIAREQVGQLFQVFTQGYQSLDRAQGGLGLGLTIVRTLTELHGGRVAVHSDGAGRGSTFEVRLPLARRIPELDALIEASTPQPRPGFVPQRVLVVDDNPDAAITLAEALSALGHETEVAHDGPSALAIAARFRPEVALLDIGLPVMDGYELAGRLRALEENGDRVRLIAITGYGQHRDRQRAFAAGFDEHFVKPVELDALIDAIATPTPARPSTVAG